MTSIPHRAVHTRITVKRRFLRWNLYVNDKRMLSLWRHDEAIVLGGFLARLSAPSTLEIAKGPHHATGERREF